jgi:hypothetical protein
MIHKLCKTIEEKCIKRGITPPNGGELLEDSFVKIITLIDKLEKKIDEAGKVGFDITPYIKIYLKENLHTVSRHYTIDKVICEMSIDHDMLDKHIKKTIAYEIVKSLLEDGIIGFDIEEKKSIIKYTGQLKVFK